MSEVSQNSAADDGASARKSLAWRILRRLLLVLLVVIVGYGLVIAFWILMSPRL